MFRDHNAEEITALINPLINRDSYHVANKSRVYALHIEVAYANLRNDAGKIFTDHRLISEILFSFKVDGEEIPSRGVFFFALEGRIANDWLALVS